jgi:hypothetical protein
MTGRGNDISFVFIARKAAKRDREYHSRGFQEDVPSRDARFI